MSTGDISLDGMSVAQKLGLMERIWVDLETQNSHVPSPEWHGDILARRIAAVQNGDVEFSDWTDVKRRLQQRHA
jgi:hypothetical protein